MNAAYKKSRSIKHFTCRRSNKYRVCCRLPLHLITLIEDKATNGYKTKIDMMDEVIRSYLNTNFKKCIPSEQVHAWEDGEKRQFAFGIDPRLNAQLEKEAVATSRTKTDVVKEALWDFLEESVTPPIPANPITKNVELDELDYPSRVDIENIFSPLLAKERKQAFKYHNVDIRRDLMIRIKKAYIDKEFTYDEIRINYNTWASADKVFHHFEYLKNYNFIIPTTGDAFKFCDRVKKWEYFGDI